MIASRPPAGRLFDRGDARHGAVDPDAETMVSQPRYLRRSAERSSPTARSFLPSHAAGAAGSRTVAMHHAASTTPGARSAQHGCADANTAATAASRQRDARRRRLPDQPAARQASSSGVARRTATSTARPRAGPNVMVNTGQFTHGANFAGADVSAPATPGPRPARTSPPASRRRGRSSRHGWQAPTTARTSLIPTYSDVGTGVSPHGSGIPAPRPGRRTSGCGWATGRRLATAGRQHGCPYHV